MAGSKSIIACSVLKLEFERIIDGRPIELSLLEQGLHSTPKIMPEKIAAKVAEAEARRPESIVLGYGLCSKGVVGVGGAETPLVIPRCHDCIALLLGSVQRYTEIFSRRPGTYYLSAGWVAENDDPLSCVEVKYTPRLGEKKAMRAMSLELANYTHICYVDNGLGDQERLKARTRENCRAFNKEYMEIEGSLDYLRKLVDGPADEEEIITLPPGRQLHEDMFFESLDR